jgi:hypothetical protein
MALVKSQKSSGKPLLGFLMHNLGLFYIYTGRFFSARKIKNPLTAFGSQGVLE